VFGEGLNERPECFRKGKIHEMSGMYPIYRHKNRRDIPLEIDRAYEGLDQLSYQKERIIEVVQE
jgi:hypothetical protein